MGFVRGAVAIPHVVHAVGGVCEIANLVRDIVDIRRRGDLCHAITAARQVVGAGALCRWSHDFPSALGEKCGEDRDRKHLGSKMS
jgi:hypothetical protein